MSCVLSGLFLRGPGFTVIVATTLGTNGNVTVVTTYVDKNQNRSGDPTPGTHTRRRNIQIMVLRGDIPSRSPLLSNFY